MDIRDAIGVSFSWSQFVKEMEKRGYTWKLNRKYPALKTPDLRIRQMEFLQKEGINTREELAAYRKPLEEQVLSLMKERRTLYRKEPGGMRIQEINGELKELRKKIRLSQQIEIQSKEMEERLKQAKEQEQIQESSGKQRREEERKR